MASEVTALDEIADRLTLIFNKQRFLREDIAAAQNTIARSEAEIDRLERVANEYMALLRVPEGNPA